MKFTLHDGYEFDRGTVKGHAYLTHSDFARMSAAFFTCRGKTPKMKSLNSNRLYVVTEGDGVFHIGIVPKNTWYCHEGTMKCFVIHSPAFDKKKELVKGK